MIVAVTNLKGGVGKTTITTNLAVCLVHRGYKVCIVDTDLGQQSSMEWSGNRDETALRVPVFGVTTKQLTKEVAELRKVYDVVLIDGTPQLTELAERTILASDAVIVPLLPSLYDFRGFEKFLEKYENIRELKQSSGGDVKAFLILNRVVPKANISKDIEEAIKEYDIELLKTKLINRVAYADTPTMGMGVVEYKDKKAKGEIESLTSEVEKRILQKVTA